MSKISKIDAKVISQLKSWNWDLIIDFGLNHVNNIKGNQNNFWRGGLIEKIIARQDDTLDFVGTKEYHKDFFWNRFKITMENKSLLNTTMYDRRGKLKPVLKVKLCSLRSKRKIKKEEICDIILVVMKDGSFIIPKNIAIHNTVQLDKQIDIVVASNHIIEISGPKNLTKVKQKVDINDMVDDFQDMLIDRAIVDFNRRNKKV